MAASAAARRGAAATLLAANAAAARDAPALLRELRAFAAAAPRRAFPSFLPADAAAVARGKKPLLEGASLLNFSCTACGACCRSHADSVLLDPHDIWRMRRAEARLTRPAAAGERGTAPLPPLPPPPPHSARFAHALGLFEVAAMRPSTIAAAGLPRGGRGVAPVVFLRTLVHHGEAAARCGFSVRAPRPGKPDALECSLGLEGMPYACSIYPLGDFFSTTERAFYSLDAKCEGVGKAAGEGGGEGESEGGEESADAGAGTGAGAIAGTGTGAITCAGTGAERAAAPRAQSVAAYARDRSLDERREAAEWFRALATSFAVSRAGAALGAAAHAGAPLPPWLPALRRAWFGDAQAATDVTTWPEERARIERDTRAVVADVGR